MSRPAVLEVDRAEWRAQALDYIVARTRQGQTVNADDLRRDLPAPDHHNQYGAVFSSAAARKLIKKIASRSSHTRSRHYGDQKEWAIHPEQVVGV
ncbi:hypothetical protein [Micrococcus terreus]|uniref:hypothetical protein n=1 Tax=Micrococcus terreus TaxID=574650 RepID=UPI003D72B1FF